jgi:hypothetical protein
MAVAIAMCLNLLDLSATRSSLERHYCFNETPIVITGGSNRQGSPPHNQPYPPPEQPCLAFEQEEAQACAAPAA